MLIYVWIPLGPFQCKRSLWFDCKFAFIKPYIEVTSGARTNNVALVRRDANVLICNQGTNPKRPAQANTITMHSLCEHATGKGNRIMVKLDYIKLKYKDGTEFLFRLLRWHI